MKKVTITLYGRDAERVIEGVEYGAHFKADYIEGFEVEITDDDIVVEDVDPDSLDD